MIPAKKLIPETETVSEQVEELKQTGNNKIQSVVKLLIMMLLTYAIIFM